MITLLKINECAIIQNANTNKKGGKKTQETLIDYMFLEAFKNQTKIKIQHQIVCKRE